MSGIGGPGRHILLASAASDADRTATIYMGGHKNAIITVDCTLDPATGEVTPRLQVLDANGDYTNIYSAAAITGVGTTSYYFGPGTIAADVNTTEAMSMQIPDGCRLLMDVTTAGSLTYSVSIERF